MEHAIPTGIRRPRRLVPARRTLLLTSQAVAVLALCASVGWHARQWLPGGEQAAAAVKPKGNVCVGDMHDCRACRTCAGCKNCHLNGGTCSVRVKQPAKPKH